MYLLMLYKHGNIAVLQFISTSKCTCCIEKLTEMVISETEKKPHRFIGMYNSVNLKKKLIFRWWWSDPIKILFDKKKQSGTHGMNKFQAYSNLHIFITTININQTKCDI